MDNLIVYGHGGKLLVKDLKLVNIHQANGGRLIVKELPSYPPIDCTQNGCDEFAEFFGLLVEADNVGDEVACSLCKECMDHLLAEIVFEVPARRTH